MSEKRKKRVRYKLKKVSTRNRLSVFRSNNHIYAQVIDDVAQNTLCAASTLEKDFLSNSKVNTSTCAASTAIGELLAKRALKKGIKQVVFDRGGNLYHGRIKALADAAREAGLEF